MNKFVFSLKQAKKSFGKLHIAPRLALAFVLAFSFLFVPVPGQPEQGRASIDQWNQQIDELRGGIDSVNGRIGQFEAELSRLHGEAMTLENQIAIFEAEIAKKDAEIDKTEKDIRLTEAEIERLTLEIAAKEEEIEYQKVVLREFIREINFEDFFRRNFFEGRFSPDYCGDDGPE